jgi:hypothetical protein
MTISALDNILFIPIFVLASSLSFFISLTRCFAHIVMICGQMSAESDTSHNPGVRPGQRAWVDDLQYVLVGTGSSVSETVTVSPHFLNMILITSNVFSLLDVKFSCP